MPCCECGENLCSAVKAQLSAKSSTRRAYRALGRTKPITWRVKAVCINGHVNIVEGTGEVKCS